uniref:Uncharacterized protein n=1 Tax=Knipowitschia caucasica TaxID=637954 RepID=A0AAV2KLZ0_KNICA
MRSKQSSEGPHGPGLAYLSFYESPPLRSRLAVASEPQPVILRVQVRFSGLLPTGLCVWQGGGEAGKGGGGGGGKFIDFCVDEVMWLGVVRPTEAAEEKEEEGKLPQDWV